MGVDCTICSDKCYGNDGQHGSCCRLEDRDWIIGPHCDGDVFIENISKKFGREIKYDDVFVEYDEGSKQFPNKSVWQIPSNYPALRVNKNDPTLPCIFYNTAMRACSVYSIRPQTCRDYECEYLTSETKKEIKFKY